MEIERQKVIQRINELNTQSFLKPTKTELHSSGIGLGRIQRRELKKYKSDIGNQKLAFSKKLSEIDDYLQSVKDNEDYLASLKTGDVLVKPTILPKPVVVFGSKPVFKETRLSRMKRRGRY